MTLVESASIHRIEEREGEAEGKRQCSEALCGKKSCRKIEPGQRERERESEGGSEREREGEAVTDLNSSIM